VTSAHDPLGVPRSKTDDHEPGIVAERQALAERLAGRPLPHLAGAPVPPREARGKIENLVGFAQVPVGLAGPLVVHTSSGSRELLVPMATTEGALVASYSRGMRLLREAGGARAYTLKVGLSQHPMLVYTSIEEATRAASVASGGFDAYAALVSGITRHGRLIEVIPEVHGRRLVLRLVFTTGDAIGINMAARAADIISEQLARETGARERYVHGQDVEKRANARAFVEGRGRSVAAEVRVERDLLQRVLRATPEQLARIWRSYAHGFARMGTQNWAVQSANGLAAVMLACGQDVAYLAECATGMLELDVEPDGSLHASVQLPSLLVGTVGGGSGQGTARECLELMGCAGTGGAEPFAEVLAATVLAGDLSLMAAFTSHEFVAAHEALGRNRPESS